MDDIHFQFALPRTFDCLLTASDSKMFSHVQHSLADRFLQVVYRVRFQCEPPVPFLM